MKTFSNCSRVSMLTNSSTCCDGATGAFELNIRAAAKLVGAADAIRVIGKDPKPAIEMPVLLEATIRRRDETPR